MSNMLYDPETKSFREYLPTHKHKDPFAERDWYGNVVDPKVVVGPDEAAGEWILYDKPLTGGSHHDTGKSRVDLLEPEWLLDVGDVLKYGCKKYAEQNWRQGIGYTRIIGSIIRHLTCIMAGQDIDKESGLPHIAHLSCNAMFLSWYMKHRREFDDRWTDEKGKFLGGDSKCAGGVHG